MVRGGLSCPSCSQRTMPTTRRSKDAGRDRAGGTKRNDHVFNELVASVREAGAIRRGVQAPSREFVFKCDDVQFVRGRLGLSQAEFANMIGVSVATLRNWEQGRRMPNGPARALLRVAARNPDVVKLALTV